VTRLGEKALADKQGRLFWGGREDEGNLGEKNGRESAKRYVKGAAWPGGNSNLSPSERGWLESGEVSEKPRKEGLSVGTGSLHSLAVLRTLIYLGGTY